MGRMTREVMELELRFFFLSMMLDMGGARRMAYSSWVDGFTTEGSPAGTGEACPERGRQGDGLSAYVGFSGVVLDPLILEP